jgi:outer membrane lipoprotein SlyB
MLRLAVVASALAAAACTTVAPNDADAFKPGTGIVEEVHGPRVPRWIDGYQLSLRMDDGTIQALRQDSPFYAGERVRVTQQGRVIRVRPIATASVTAPAAPVPVRPGGASVQAVGAASPISAAAGASAPSATEGTDEQIVILRMDDGATQALAVRGATFQPGERVNVTSDRRVLKP